jgi:RNA polymerase sigma factor (sigma-70 family)
MKPHPPRPADDDASFAGRAARLYGADLHWFLVGRLKSDQDAKDVIQEIYLRLLRLGRGDLVQQPRAYVYFVARQVLAQFRMRARLSPMDYNSRLVLERDRYPDEVRKDEVADRLIALTEAEHLLNALPATHRKVFAMRTFDGLSWTDIGDRLGISVHTVKKYVAQSNARIAVMRKEQ